jgi:beta-lactamase class D
VTAVNRNNQTDNRVSELEVWEQYFNKDKNEWRWKPLGKKSARDVAKLLADGHKVYSAEEKKINDKIKISLGDEIEFVFRIAGNNEHVKITDMPSF